MKKKLLFFHPYMAPYRIDLFNDISKCYRLKLFFKYENDPSQKFDVNILKQNVYFSFDYVLKGFRIFKRDVRFGVWKIYVKEKPEIIFTHEFSSFSLRALIFKFIKGKNIKWILMSDDSLEILKNLPLYRRISRKLILPYIDGLITINEEVKDWHLNFYPKLSLNIFNFPILQNDIVFRDKLKISLPVANHYIEEYGLENKKVALYVGRLSKEKGINKLVKIFSQLSDPNIRLIIVGDGELKEEIKTFLNERSEKRIILVGRFDGLQLVSWYNVASFFILPSSYEPFGAVINEALLSGLYSLCSKNAGVNNLIIEGQNGSLIDPLDESDIKEKLIQTINRVTKVNKNIIVIRKNLMPISYSFKFTELINFIEL